MPIASNLIIDLQSSTHIFDTTRKDIINNAIVVFYRNDTIIDTLDFDVENKNYIISKEMSDYPEIGDKCSLVIQHEDYATISSSTSIPNIIKILDSQIVPVAFFDEYDAPYSEATITFSDPKEQINYYEIIVSGITEEVDSYKELTTNNKVITSEPYYPSLFEFDKTKPKRLLFSDNLINGTTTSVNVFYLAPYKISETRYIPQHYVTIHLNNVTEEYYKNQTTFIQHINTLQENILYGSGEPNIVYTNINNGYGVFAGYNSDKFSHKIDSIGL